MPYVNDPSDSRQVQEELAIEQAEFQVASYACRCPRCDRFGTVQNHDDYYGTVYLCNCLPPSTNLVKSGNPITTQISRDAPPTTPRGLPDFTTFIGPVCWVIDPETGEKFEGF